FVKGSNFRENEHRARQRQVDVGTNVVALKTAAPVVIDTHEFRPACANDLCLRIRFGAVSVPEECSVYVCATVKSCIRTEIFAASQKFGKPATSIGRMVNVCVIRKPVSDAILRVA